MRHLLSLLPALLATFAAPLQAQDGGDLSPRSGTVVLREASASLDLGDRYAFYGPQDARTIIVDIWENPPEQADGVLGIIMPAGASPRKDGWGGVVTYRPTGWISNEDARSVDFAAILDEMQDQARADNFERRDLGYPEIEVVGWAQAPFYDSVSHAMVWARELDFADRRTNSLAYDLRLLGRRGVLSINFVADIDKLPQIRSAAADIAEQVQFAPGERYEDFDPASDAAAGYGLAGLVASGVGLAVAKQVGAVALLLKFAKPLLIGLGLVLALVFAPMLAILRRRRRRDGASA